MQNKKINLKLLLAITLIGFTTIVTAQTNGYKNGIGLRGGYTSGLTIKHFVTNAAAVEGIIGTRYNGLSLTGLYEWHTGKALETSGLAFEYGFGARIGFYNGKYYQERNSIYYYPDKNYSVISLVGIVGLEYKFKGAPFTLGFDVLPYIDLSYQSNNYFDGSIALRYTF